MMNVQKRVNPSRAGLTSREENGKNGMLASKLRAVQTPLTGRVKVKGNTRVNKNAVVLRSFSIQVHMAG